ncbi:DUF551 domain-containing protein [Serratia marcescens]|nr:DUF551 domain-containing protein [Serratia marcescens]
MTLTTERLREIASSPSFSANPLSHEVKYMARELLANREAQPVAIVEPSDYVTAAQLVGEEPRSKAVRPLFEGALAIGMELYTAPPAPAVPGIDELRLAFERAERESDDGFNLHKYGIGYADEATQARWESWLACRAAMLNHVSLIGEGDMTRPQIEPQNIPNNIPGYLAAAVNRLLDCDGTRGHFSAIRCSDAREEVERLLAQPVSGGYKLPEGWIPCSERMPVDTQTVLCSNLLTELSGIPFIADYVGEFQLYDGTKYESGFYINRELQTVTHWMPLPAAPEGGNDHDTRR